MTLATLKPRLQTLNTNRLKVLDTKAGATPMEGGRAWMEKRKRVALRHSYRCAGCGRLLLPRQWECDHIVPREQGGSNDESNLQPLCAWMDEAGVKQGCHKAKTAREAEARARGGAG